MLDTLQAECVIVVVYLVFPSQVPISQPSVVLQITVEVRRICLDEHPAIISTGNDLGCNQSLTTRLIRGH